MSSSEEYYTVGGQYKDEHLWCGTVTATPKMFDTVPENWWEQTADGGFWAKHSLRWCCPKEER